MYGNAIEHEKVRTSGAGDRVSGTIAGHKIICNSGTNGINNGETRTWNYEGERLVGRPFALMAKGSEIRMITELEALESITQMEIEDWRNQCLAVLASMNLSA